MKTEPTAGYWNPSPTTIASAFNRNNKKKLLIFSSSQSNQLNLNDGFNIVASILLRAVVSSVILIYVFSLLFCFGIRIMICTSSKVSRRN